MTGPITQPTNNYIGVNIAGEVMRAAAVTNEGTVAERYEAPVDPDRLIPQIAHAVAELRDVSSPVTALGIGVPGLVNPQRDRIVVSSDFPALARSGSDFYTELVRATGLTVALENDANAAAYGEYVAGTGDGSSSMFYVTIGSGVGGALILEGNLWLGASGFAGEIGHITIDPEGIECVCGNRGCLETVASAPNIVRRTHERLYRDGTSSLSRLALNKNFTAADVAREAIEGDDFASMMIERTGKYIGVAVASVINLLNVERVVLGGAVMTAGDLILNPIVDEARRRSFQPSFEATQIVLAALGTDAVPVGAALRAREVARHNRGAL